MKMCNVREAIVYRIHVKSVSVFIYAHWPISEIKVRFSDDYRQLLLLCVNYRLLLNFYMKVLLALSL